MRASYSRTFKIKAVKKALNRHDATTIQEVAKTLGIGHSTLNKWITKARNLEFESVSVNEITSMKQDKRPQDWSLEERLNAITACHSLDETKKNEYCRRNGIYPHHIDQWKQEFIQILAGRSDGL